MKVFTILIFACLAASSWSYKCYQCHSEDDSACEDPYEGDSDHETDCGEPQKGQMGACGKTKMIGMDGSTEITVVYRFCGISGTYDAICGKKYAVEFEVAATSMDGVNITDGTYEVCDCTAELCNGAPAMTATIFSVLPLSVFSVAISCLIRSYF